MADGPERLALWNEARTAERRRLEALVEAGEDDPAQYEPPGWRKPVSRALPGFDLHELAAMRKRRREEVAAQRLRTPRLGAAPAVNVAVLMPKALACS